MNRIIIISAIMTMALAAGCAGGAASGSSADTEAVATATAGETPTATQTPAPTQTPTATQTPPATQTRTATEKADPGPITKQEVASFIEEYTRVLLYADIDRIPKYLSATCSREDREGLVGLAALTAAYLFIAGAADFKFSISVDPEKLVVDIADDRAVIAGQQPEGAIILRADGRSLPDEASGLDLGEPLVLVREQGLLMTTECIGAADELERLQRILWEQE